MCCLMIYQAISHAKKAHYLQHYAANKHLLAVSWLRLINTSIAVARQGWKPVPRKRYLVALRSTADSPAAHQAGRPFLYY